MLSILYLTSFTITNAAPLSASVVNIATQQVVCPNQRTIWNIIWSCLATIFACSWVSVHPNIPGPDDSWMKKALKRLELMFWSIIAPELVTYWAAKQWLAAWRLSNKYHEYGWTRTHGYFIQMGGFVLYDGDKAIGILGPRQLEDLHAKGKIEVPLVKESDIKDRSKGDGLSKALVIIQTTWFVIQCIARKVEGLVITQLELVTAALAVLNGIMYFLWWNKPLNVQSSIPVYLLAAKPFDTSSSSDRCKATAEPDLNVKNIVQSDNQEGPNQPLKLLEPSTPVARDPAVQEKTSDIKNVKNKDESQYQSLKPLDSSNAIDRCDVIEPATREGKNIETQIESDGKKVTPNQELGKRFPPRYILAGARLLWRFSGLGFLNRGLTDMISGGKITGEGQMCVPTFYADENDDWMVEGPISFFACIVGILFSAIHLAGWNFVFQSNIERDIWRVASIHTMAVPAYMSIMNIIEMILAHYIKDNNPFYYKLVMLILVLVFLPAYALYFPMRFALLVEALIALRGLPQEALAVVSWTLFIPHI